MSTIPIPVIVPTAGDSKPCDGKSELFESLHGFDHELAARMCVGDGKDIPPCPFIGWCQQEREEFQASEYRGGLHGTWHGSLFIKGQLSAKAKRRPGRPRKATA